MSRIVTGCLLSVVLVFSSYVALNRGLASLYAYPGKSTLSLWRDGKHQPQQPDWEMARGSLEKALSYDGRDPDLLHELGATYDAEMSYYTPGAAAATYKRNMARQNYLAALTGRPTWPHDWIVLALVKYRLNQADAEFYQALRRSVALGPLEPSVKYVVADIGLHHWDKLNNDMRTLVTGIIRYAVNNRGAATDMLKLLRRYDMLDMVCNDESEIELVGTYCKQYHHPE